MDVPQGAFSPDAMDIDSEPVNSVSHATHIKLPLLSIAWKITPTLQAKTQLISSPVGNDKHDRRPMADDPMVGIPEASLRPPVQGLVPVHQGGPMTRRRCREQNMKQSGASTATVDRIQRRNAAATNKHPKRTRTRRVAPRQPARKVQGSSTAPVRAQPQRKHGKKAIQGAIPCIKSACTLRLVPLLHCVCLTRVRIRSPTCISKAARDYHGRYCLCTSPRYTS